MIRRMIENEGTVTKELKPGTEAAASTPEPVPVKQTAGSRLSMPLTLASTFAVLMLQILLVGSPDPLLLKGDAGFGDPVLLNIPPASLQNLGEDPGALDSATTYASVVSSDATPQKDAFVGLANFTLLYDYDDPQMRQPSGLFFTHAPHSFRAQDSNPGLRRTGTTWVKMPYLDSHYAHNATAFAVGDINRPVANAPLGTHSEDIVVGFNNFSRFVILLDPDASVFGAPNRAHALMPGSSDYPQTRTVSFNCGNDGVCPEATVQAITTGLFNDDNLRDIALIAQTSLPNNSDTLEYLFVCLQTQNINFICHAAGEMAEEPGGSGGNVCAGAGKGTGCSKSDNPYPESFQIAQDTDSPGRVFFGIRSVGTQVQVFRFAGTPGGQLLNFNAYDYGNPVASASLWDYTGDARLDLVVQLQPENPTWSEQRQTWDPFSFPYLEVTQGRQGMPLRRVSVNNVYPSLDTQITDRLVTMISNYVINASRGLPPTEFIKATPLAYANFSALGANEFGVSGRLWPAEAYDPWGSAHDTKQLVGGMTRNVVNSNTIASGDYPPVPHAAFAGEFLRSNITADNGTTPMLPDYATLTDPLYSDQYSGNRLIMLQANKTLAAAVTSGKLLPGNATTLSSKMVREACRPGETC